MTLDTYEVAKGMEAHFGYWGESPSYPVADWKYAVANGDTRHGYWMWAASKVVGG